MSRVKVGIFKTIIEPKTITMYHMHTCGSNKCIYACDTYCGDFRFNDGFGYTYLRLSEKLDPTHNMCQEFSCMKLLGSYFNGHKPYF